MARTWITSLCLRRRCSPVIDPAIPVRNCARLEFTVSNTRLIGAPNAWPYCYSTHERKISVIEKILMISK